MCDEDVVISGIGCHFPQADGLEELSEKLFKGENMVTKDAIDSARGIAFYL